MLHCSLRDDFIEAISGVMKRLTRRTAQNKYLFVGELLAGGRDFKPKMVCLKKSVNIIFFVHSVQIVKIFSSSVCALGYNVNLLLGCILLQESWLPLK